MTQLFKPFENAAYPCYLLCEGKLLMNDNAKNCGPPLGDEKTVAKMLQVAKLNMNNDTCGGITSLPLMTDALCARNLTLMQTEEGLLAVVQNQKEAPVINFSGQMRELLSNIFATLPLLDQKIDGVGHRYVEEVQSNSYQLLRLANNLENASSIEKHSYNLQCIDLSSLASSLCYCADSICRRQEIPIEWSVPDYPLPVKADSRLLSCALLNLVRNSIQYTRDGNKISVKVGKAGNKAIITVEDKGLGILPENLPHIFEPYFSCDPYGDDDMNPSLGLGLPVVREAVKSFGGTVNVESRFGEGTRCHIALPLSNDASDILSSETSDYLLNRYSQVYVQLSGFCKLPGI